MKRIDEKIQELEKKDKRSRISYIIFVAVMILFSLYAMSREKELKSKEIKLTNTYQDLERVKLNLEVTLDNLEKSLKPEEYWDHTVSEKSVEACINYLTNNWGVDKIKIDEMIIYCKSLSGDYIYEGWIYCGKVVAGDFQDQRVDIIWRKNSTPNKKSLPRVNDIIQSVNDRNLKAYKKSTYNQGNGRRNNEGWRPTAKAIVTDVDNSSNGAEIRIKIMYY